MRGFHQQGFRPRHGLGHRAVPRGAISLLMFPYAGFSRRSPPTSSGSRRPAGSVAQRPPAVGACFVADAVGVGEPRARP
eukprot:5001009-Lingulodinium_polyedra.AAC.1